MSDLTSDRANAVFCREVITNAIAASKAVDESKIKKGKRDFCSLYLPENTQIDAKNNKNENKTTSHKISHLGTENL